MNSRRDGEQPDADGAETVERKHEQALVAVQRAARHPATIGEAALLDRVHLDLRAVPREVEPDTLPDEEELVLALGDHESERPLVGRRRTVRTALGLAGRR